jgi:hypothetical protein
MKAKSLKEEKSERVGSDWISTNLPLLQIDGRVTWRCSPRIVAGSGDSHCWPQRERERGEREREKGDWCSIYTVTTASHHHEQEEARWADSVASAPTSSTQDAFFLSFHFSSASFFCACVSCAFCRLLLPPCTACWSLTPWSHHFLAHTGSAGCTYGQTGHVLVWSYVPLLTASCLTFFVFLLWAAKLVFDNYVAELLTYFDGR